MSVSDGLFALAKKLLKQSSISEDGSYNDSLDKLEKAANEVGKSWGGSWLGYHSRVYYKDFADPPTGARFSQEWGFMYDYSRGEWRECKFDDVIDVIKELAGNPDLANQESSAVEAKEEFEEIQSAVISKLTHACESHANDNFLADLLKKAKDIKIFSQTDFINQWSPKGTLISRDMAAVEKGVLVPPHYSILANIHALRYSFVACRKLEKIARRAASHLMSEERQEEITQRIGTKIFIGHGRSTAWKDLKDFIQDRLHLPWDEFNRVSVAGFTNIARLSQMLDESAMAFLILTAEDEQADGKMHARMNVIHEAGLFQGRLGFERAIILFEEGCEEFSNIQGLGQIRFPAGKISGIFEEIRRVLEREKIIEN